MLDMFISFFYICKENLYAIFFVKYNLIVIKSLEIVDTMGIILKYVIKTHLMICFALFIWC